MINIIYNLISFLLLLFLLRYFFDSSSNFILYYAWYIFKAYGFPAYTRLIVIIICKIITNFGWIRTHTFSNTTFILVYNIIIIVILIIMTMILFLSGWLVLFPMNIICIALSFMSTKHLFLLFFHYIIYLLLLPLLSISNYATTLMTSFTFFNTSTRPRLIVLYKLLLLLLVLEWKQKIDFKLILVFVLYIKNN